MSCDEQKLEIEKSGLHASVSEGTVSSEVGGEGNSSETVTPSEPDSSAGSKMAKSDASSNSHVAKKNRKKKRRKRKIVDSILGNPLFWILVIIGALLLFIAFFEHVPQFGVNKVYHIFN